MTLAQTLRSILLPIAILAASTSYAGSPQTDSATQARLTNIETTLLGLKKNTSDSKPNTSAPATTNKCVDTQKSDPWLFWILVLLPLLLSFVGLLMSGISKDDVSKAITDKDAPIQTVKKNITLPTTVTTAGGTEVTDPGRTDETTQTTGYQKSASRLLLFLTGTLTLILALCLVMVFIAGYLKCMEAPQYTSLTNVLLALGIGVIPYAASQVKAAVQPDSPKPDSTTTTITNPKR